MDRDGHDQAVPAARRRRRRGLRPLEDGVALLAPASHAGVQGRPDRGVRHARSLVLQEERQAERRRDRRLRSEEHTSELQSLTNLVCRLLLEKKKKHNIDWSRLDLTSMCWYGDK